jgi:hypothetical protein
MTSTVKTPNQGRCTGITRCTAGVLRGAVILADEGTGQPPVALRLIPPDETEQFEVPWTYGPVCEGGRIQLSSYLFWCFDVEEERGRRQVKPRGVQEMVDALLRRGPMHGSDVLELCCVVLEGAVPREGHPGHAAAPRCDAPAARRAQG